MEKELYIFGKNLSPEKKEKIENRIRQEREKTSQPFENEIEKTSEEIKFINLADSWLTQEFKEIGIAEKPDIRPEIVHFLSREEFKKICRHKDCMAFASFPENNIYINKDAPPHRLELYATIMHEAVHMPAFEKIYAEVKKPDDNLICSQYRRGYRVENPAEENHEHFRGLGEIIADKTVIEIFHKHKEKLISELNITPEEEKLPISFYDGLDILDIVIGKLARKKNESEKTVWREFKKGQFTGRMTHLKDVERTFGKGSLRMLAAFDSEGSTKSLPPEIINKKIFRYFETDDESEREKIASEVLSERERLEYLKRRS